MKIIDLTHEIHTGMMAYPGDPEISLEEVAIHETDGCHVDYFMGGSHTGTHIDAPYHFIPDGKRITDYPVSRFIGEGAVCDLRNKKAGEVITADDIRPCLGGFSKGDFLLLQTGWCEKYGTDEYLNHPYISAEAAQLISDCGVSIIAVDFLNVDPTLWEQWDAHSILLSNEVLIVENINNSLELDAGVRYSFCFVPMKLGDSDGAPVRAYAMDKMAG